MAQDRTTGGNVTPISNTLIGRMTGAISSGARSFIAGVNEAWFGPGQPLAPMAPEGTGGRQFDYSYGQNLQYQPKSEGNTGVSYDQLRQLADNWPLLRAAIETRKDQLLNTYWSVKPKNTDRIKDGKKVKEDPRCQAITEFFQFPDKENEIGVWIRQLVEEMLVIDAACIYPRPTMGGDVYSLDLVDGATIKRLIDENGRTPEAPNPAYQQILHGVPAADFTRDELIYLPRNKRVHKMYGYSPVEQIVLTVNIALRRDVSTLNYYTEGTVPDAFVSLPKEWTIDQVRQFQDYFDFLMTGNLAERRKARFIPGDTDIHEMKTPPLKDQYDEWLARVVCWALNVAVSPLVSQVNRATGETLKVSATEEGKHPTQDWLKSIFNIIIWKHFKCPDLEFVWEDSDNTDVLKLAQARDIYTKGGLLGIDEVREDMGREGIGVGNVIITATGPIPLKEAMDKAIEDIKNPPPPPIPLQAQNIKPGEEAPQPGDPKQLPPPRKEVGKTADRTFRKDAHTGSEVRQAGDALRAQGHGEGDSRHVA